MKKNSTKKALALKTRIIIIFTSVAFIALASVVVYLLFYINNNKEEEKKDTRPTVATEDNIDEVIDAMDEPVEDGYYEVTMNTSWNFKDGSSNAFVENSINNKRTVYFDVTLSDTGELVYSSPYIPVGEKIQNFDLDTNLASGSYNALVTYHLVDENNEEVSNLSVTVTFQVD